MRNALLYLLGLAILLIMPEALLSQTREMNSAKLYYQQGEYDKAIEWFEKALAKDPKNAEAHFRLGELYGMRGRFSEMEHEFDASLSYSKKYEKEIQAQRQKFRIKDVKTDIRVSTEPPGITQSGASTVTAQGTVKPAAGVAASSQLIERNRPSDAYKAENLTDGNIATAWAEGADDAGIGEWIRFGFDTPRKIKAIKILAGYAKTDPVYWNNNRVKKVQVIFSDGWPQIAELKDVNEFQRIIIDRDRPTKFVKLEILEVFKGRKFDDTCISEIDFETVAGSSQILSQQITESVTAGAGEFGWFIPFEGSEEFLSLPSGDEVLQLKYERAGKLVTLVDDDLTIEVEFDSISSEGSWGGFGVYGPEFIIIKRLSFAIHGQEVEIPAIAYSDLANINYDRPDQFFLSRTGENYFMSIGGAGAGERYAATFIIQGHKLVRREVWWGIGGEATSGRIEFN